MIKNINRYVVELVSNDKGVIVISTICHCYSRFNADMVTYSLRKSEPHQCFRFRKMSKDYISGVDDLGYVKSEVK